MWKLLQFVQYTYYAYFYSYVFNDHITFKSYVLQKNAPMFKAYIMFEKRILYLDIKRMK